MAFGRPVPTLFTYAYPRGFVDIDAVRYLDIYEFADAYEWEIDGFSGILDLAQPVDTTVEKRSGDCEDAALVYLSWMVANDRQNPRLIFAIEYPWPFPKHVAAADGERVYSNGHIYEDTTPDEYIEMTPYDTYLTRHL